MTNYSCSTRACDELTRVLISAGKTETRVNDLEARIGRIDARLNLLLWFILGTLATSAGTLVMVVINLLSTRSA